MHSDMNHDVDGQMNREEKTTAETGHRWPMLIRLHLVNKRELQPN